MTTKRRSGLTALLTLTAIVLGATAGLAAPSIVNTLNATASGQTVSVSGSATFGGEDPVLIGEDGVGDALAGGQAGLDIDKLYISQPNPATNSLLFTMTLGGLQGGGIPEGFQYNWDVAVDGGATEGGDNWSIKFMRSRASATTNANPYAAVYRCVPDGATGGFTCTEATRITNVVFDEAKAEIRLMVTFASIGIAAGGTIDPWARNGDPVWVRPSASGALTGGASVDGTTHEQYRVPTKSVALGLAAPGDPISFDTPATVLANGNFSGSLLAPGAGTYDVAARACFGSNCATRMTSVTAA